MGALTRSHTTRLDNRFHYRDKHELLSISLLRYSYLIWFLFPCRFIPPLHHMWLHSRWFPGAWKIMSTLPFYTSSPGVLEKLWAFCSWYLLSWISTLYNLFFRSEAFIQVPDTFKGTFLKRETINFFYDDSDFIKNKKIVHYELQWLFNK